MSSVREAVLFYSKSKRLGIIIMTTAHTRSSYKDLQ